MPTKRETLSKGYAERFGHIAPRTMDPPSDEEIIPMFEHALKIGEPVREWVEFWQRRKESNARFKASGAIVNRDGVNTVCRPPLTIDLSHWTS